MAKTNTVLVVDDEKEMRDLIGSQLEQLSLNYIEAADGSSALEIVQKSDVDLIISDVKMPIMDGLEMLEQLRKKQYHQPVIILTGEGSKESAIKAIRYDVTDFIEKPYNPQNLLESATEALSKSAELKKIKRQNNTQNILVEDPVSIKILQKDFSNSWKVGKTPQSFLDAVTCQLKFANVSLDWIKNEMDQEKELTFLGNMLSDMSKAAYFWGYYELSSIALKTEALTRILLKRSAVDPEGLKLVTKGLNTLSAATKEYSDPGSQKGSLSKIKNEIREYISNTESK